MVLQRYVAHQGLIHILGAFEAVCFEDVCNPAVKALNHAIGFGRARLVSMYAASLLPTIFLRCKYQGCDIYAVVQLCQ